MFSCQHPTPPIVPSLSAQRPPVKKVFSDSLPSSNAWIKKNSARNSQNLAGGGGGGRGGGDAIFFRSDLPTYYVVKVLRTSRIILAC